MRQGNPCLPEHNPHSLSPARKRVFFSPCACVCVAAGGSGEHLLNL